MRTTGPPVWAPGRLRDTALAVAFAALGTASVSRGGALFVLAGVAQLAIAVLAAARASTGQVRTDDAGVHVRVVPWAEVSVPWTDVDDIRSDRPRSTPALVVVRVDGTRVPTRLDPVEHRSLVDHWRGRTVR